MTQSTTYPSYGIEGHMHQVHTLVAKVFLPDDEARPIVNHRDGNKVNCSVDNLEYCTYSENVQHARDTGLLDTTIPVVQLS